MYNCEVFLCPVFPFVAPPIESYLQNMIHGYEHTLYWNVLGMPSGLIP